MKGNIFLILILLFFSSCEKDGNNDDLSGEESIRGRLFLVNDLIQQGTPTPLPKKKVTLSYTSSTDMQNYLFSATTDDNGYFTFTNLKKGTSYRVQYEEKVDNVVYTALKDATAPQNIITLEAKIATDKQSGLHITVIDPEGKMISNVNVCVFTNQLLFEVGACEASDFQLKSDPYGRVYKFGISPGNYFIKASIKINDIDYLVKKTIEVGNDIKIETLQLEKIIPVPVGFQYTVIDTTGTKISGVNLCVFTSRVTFGGKSCSGSAYQIVTGVDGKASKFGLNPGKYFIYGTIKTYNNLDSDSLIYEGLDSVIVEEIRVTNRELILKKAKI